MTKILMVLDNAFRPDQRVLKEIQTLVGLNCNIDLYCWDHDSDLAEYETRNGFNITRVKLKVAKQLGLAKLKYLLKFYKKLLEVLKENKTDYDFIYVHDFLLLPLGAILKFKLKVKLIYDAHEIYHIMEWEKYPSLIRKLIYFTERTFIKFTNHFIVVSEHRKNFYLKDISKKINVIGNWFDEYSGKNIDLRKEYNISDSDIVIGYFGVINLKVRPINKIISKVKENDNIHFFIGGVGADEDKIGSLVKDIKNVHYIGWLENVREYVNSLDYVVYVMNNTRKYSAYTAPNTIYLAISHKKPILTNVVGEPLEIITDYKVGQFITDIDDFTLENLDDQNQYHIYQKNIELIRKNYVWSKSEEVYSQILGDQ